MSERNKEEPRSSEPKHSGHVRPHPDERQKRRLGEQPETRDEKGMPIGNGAIDQPAAFPPHN